MDVVLEVKKVSKIYGTNNHVFQALKDINLEMIKGEFVGIMGPSGAGKSTLLNILSTIDVPTSGSIRINGYKVNEMNENDLADFRRDRLGFIFQDFNLLDTLTVKENILLPLALANANPKVIENKLKQVATTFGIEPILERYPYEISGGQQQRTATARAIVTNPDLIFADEPTGALDSKSALNLLQTLKKLNEQEQASIMMVTHDSFAASFCSRVLFIKDGAIFSEIRRGEQSRKEFFQQVIHVLTVLGGGGHHDVI
ncbi:ABC transporter ATP-binding protein [Heyndrickxia sp. NPDC080065]|uniref:ABC transporter ATP-binding protein n=1 Tax=Heyndrickxia sp. NPDC080065 TaxID=3390568 RepID=UPI003D049BBE